MTKTNNRKLFRIGPGLIIALAICTVLVGMKYSEMRKQAGECNAPPIVERQVVSSSCEEKSGLTPEVRFIMDRSSKIGLSNAQLIELRKLQSDWEKFYGPKLAQADEAASKTSKYLSGAQDNRKTPTAQIEDQARPLVTLSGEISMARRNYWNRAIKILTPGQQKKIQAEHETAWALKMKSLPGKK